MELYSATKETKICYGGPQKSGKNAEVATRSLCGVSSGYVTDSFPFTKGVFAQEIAATEKLKNKWGQRLLRLEAFWLVIYLESKDLVNYM